MKSLFMLVFMSVSLVSCSNQVNLSGFWKIELALQDQTLPVILNLKQTNNNISGYLLNSDEKVPLSGKLDKDSFEIEIGTTYAVFKGKVVNNKISGHWIRTNRQDYQVKFSGGKVAKDSLFKVYETKDTLLKVDGEWKVDLGEGKYGLGVFSQHGSRVQGSILTATGDYRYLDGHLESNQLRLYGFDGTFSFVINLVVNPKNFEGIMYAGKSHHMKLVGTKDAEFKLADATTLTKLKNKKPFVLRTKDMDGNTIDFGAGNLKGKAKVVQIFGSWCPNCMDELNYFIKWRKENKAKLNHLEFIAVAFENFKTLNEATKVLNKLRNKIGMKYPIVIGDHASTKTVTDMFPIEKTRAFPTTLFLNKKNEVIKIHTGFSGQATGNYFKNFQSEFNDTIEKLIQ